MASSKTIDDLRRKMNSSAGEVVAIHDKGKKAMNDSSSIVTFKDPSLPGKFPTDEEKTTASSVRKYYYECNIMYERIPIPTSTVTSQETLNLSCQSEFRPQNLPKIQIPKFDGQLKNWTKFKDTFTPMVHEETKLPVIQKYYYLISSLTDSASTVISHLQLEENNYPLAWKALTDMYDHKRLIASEYLNQVIDFKALPGKSNFNSLQSFLSNVCDNIAAFKLLRIPDESSFILFHLAARGLDQNNRERFEIAHKAVEFPTIDNLSKFIREQCMALQLSEANMKAEKPVSSGKQWKPKTVPHRASTSSLALAVHALPANKFGDKRQQKSKNEFSCFICGAQHHLYKCKQFCDASTSRRHELIKDYQGCKNCLYPDHKTITCPSKWTCKWCASRHNSMLCLKLISPSSNSTSTNSTSTPFSSGETTNNACLSVVPSTSSRCSNIIYGTAIAHIKDGRGFFIPVRLVIDCCSAYSFITSKFAKRLGLTLQPCKKRLSGLGNQIYDCTKGQVECSFKPRNSEGPILVSRALVVDEITSHLPSASLARSTWSEYQKFVLADPTFFKSGPIEALIGLDLFTDILSGSPISIVEGLPKLIPSIFGHIVMGPATNSPVSDTDGSVLLIGSDDHDLNSNLQRFWEIEELPSHHPSENPEDIACEEHFRSTFSRNEDGSYVLRLPFKNPPPDLSSIASSALRRFQNLEAKLSKDCELRSLYSEFMEEYSNLQHMSPTTIQPKYIIPHHCVTKEEKNKIKIRVVFDGSASSANGSLNQYLMVGPKMQADIRDILMNLRCHAVVFTADMVKMYRAIWIHPDDRPYQCVYWRSSTVNAIQTYQLNTVTYGLSSSPYQAIRTIRQLCIDEGNAFPNARKILQRDVFVDDIVTGADSFEEADSLKKEIIACLKQANFSLSKWASNDPRLIRDVIDSSSSPVSMAPKDDHVIKILGLVWNPQTDFFQYKIVKPTSPLTKRGILSSVARLFDPLGFLSPYIILLKMFIQELWKLGLDWDQPVPEFLKGRWEEAISDIESLSKIKIPRLITVCKPYHYQIVGFCDASTKAYCATLYLRTIKNADINVHLLTAKTKLAPLKTLTVPRLELCGAVLLARLYQSTLNFTALLHPQRYEPRFFTDSSIVLGWLNTPTYNLKCYVANRVAEIINIIPASHFYHVESAYNPSDCGSRGLFPNKLNDFGLWWNGPAWLMNSENQWPLSNDQSTNSLPELKDVPVVLIETAASNLEFIETLMSRFSSYSKLLRVVARIKRLARNRKGTSEKLSGPLQPLEVNNALVTCIKLVQLHYFFNGNPDNIEGTLQRFIKLNPFVDSLGILRAGGRLFNSTLPYNHKHPILLPPKCHFTTIVVDYFHQIHLHPGPSLLQALIQTRFWIPSLRRLVLKRIFKCIRCFKLKAQSVIPKMADLPSHRLKGDRAFVRVGIDFAGPFNLRESMKRKAAISKVYMSLYVCFATKAIHIEIVSNLSSQAFLASFDRFISRRGMPSDIFSDNGSNFVAASRELKSLWSWFHSSGTQDAVTNHCSHNGITWHFAPPRAPHFCGLMEAGVKSAKTIFAKVVGENPLTFEEMATLFSRVEAVLNSRPLCPLSADPGETNYLSPGHFLIGEPLLTPPAPSLEDLKLNTLDRWQLLKRTVETFWKRWRIEYLSTLQSRAKWSKSSPNVVVGTLVLLKDSNVPVLQWPAAIVEAVHPGKDGAVRVVTLRTAKSTYKRPVACIVPLLPLNEKAYD